MKQYVKDVMTKDPICLSDATSTQKAAEEMRTAGVGAILVQGGDGRIKGLLTDRDIAIRVVANGDDASSVPIGRICSEGVAVVKPEDRLEEAVKLMAQKGVRRLPVVDGGGKALGIVSLGDLALARDPDSALGSISSKPANV